MCKVPGKEHIALSKTFCSVCGDTVDGRFPCIQSCTGDPQNKGFDSDARSTVTSRRDAVDG
jgi:hypothetical protein